MEEIALIQSERYNESSEYRTLTRSCLDVVAAVIQMHVPLRSYHVVASVVLIGTGGTSGTTPKTQYRGGTVKFRWWVKLGSCPHSKFLLVDEEVDQSNAGTQKCTNSAAYPDVVKW